MKSLKQEKENLTIHRKAQQETYDYFKDYTINLPIRVTPVDDDSLQQIGIRLIGFNVDIHRRFF